jgi:hypothetical protein
MFLRRDVDRPGQIALAFEPVPGRRVTDIRGEFWLDDNTAELRSLVFRYTSLPGSMPGGDYSGEASFERLPGGAWIVQDWQIRSPIVQLVPGFGRQRVFEESTTGYYIEGARVLLVQDQSGNTISGAPPAALAGAGRDSVRPSPGAPAAARPPAGTGPARVTGAVSNTEDGKPVPGVVVSITGTELRRETDTNGVFRFTEVPAGPLELRTAHLGFSPVDHRMDIEQGRVYDVVIRLTPRAIPLDPLTVSVSVKELLPLGLASFYARVDRGSSGRFVLREEIEQRSQRLATDLLITAGVNVVGQALYMKRLGCAPTVYLDGIKVTHREPPQPGEAFDAANILLPFDIEGIEVYAGAASVPPEFGGSSAGCGVIAIWSRRGPARR